MRARNQYHTLVIWLYRFMGRVFTSYLQLLVVTFLVRLRRFKLYLIEKNRVLLPGAQPRLGRGPSLGLDLASSFDCAEIRQKLATVTF